MMDDDDDNDHDDDYDDDDDDHDDDNFSAYPFIVHFVQLESRSICRSTGRRQESTAEINAENLD